MAFNTEIMTATEVKDEAINDLAFDETYFEDYILNTQRKYIRPVLGKDWYNEILDQIQNATLTADNTIIVEDWLKPALAHYVVYAVYNKVHTQLTNQGSMSNGTEFSDQAMRFEYSMSRDFYIGQADDIKRQMIEYIKDEQDDDSAKYPLYKTCDDDDTQFNKKGIIFY